MVGKRRKLAAERLKSITSIYDATPVRRIRAVCAYTVDKVLRQLANGIQRSIQLSGCITAFKGLYSGHAWSQAFVELYSVYSVYIVYIVYSRIQYTAAIHRIHYTSLYTSPLRVPVRSSDSDCE